MAHETLKSPLFARRKNQLEKYESDESKHAVPTIYYAGSRAQLLFFYILKDRKIENFLPAKAGAILWQVVNNEP